MRGMPIARAIVSLVDFVIGERDFTINSKPAAIMLAVKATGTQPAKIFGHKPKETNANIPRKNAAIKHVRPAMILMTRIC